MSRDAGARIERLPPEEARRAAVEAGIPEGMGDLSVFGVLLNHPRLAGAVHTLLAMLLWEGELDPRLRELVILRIAWATGSVYEWTHHWGVARGIGMSDDELLGVRDPDAHDYGPAQRAVLRATDETLETGRISPGTWAACAEHLGPRELLELVVAISNWRLFSSLLRSLEVPLEDGVEPWPPDGRSP